MGLFVPLFKNTQLQKTVEERNRVQESDKEEKDNQTAAIRVGDSEAH
jgi:hypothetical protein